MQFCLQPNVLFHVEGENVDDQQCFGIFYHTFGLVDPKFFHHIFFLTNEVFLSVYVFLVFLFFVIKQL